MIAHIIGAVDHLRKNFRSRLRCNSSNFIIFYQLVYIIFFFSLRDILALVLKLQEVSEIYYIVPLRTKNSKISNIKNIKNTNYYCINYFFFLGNLYLKLGNAFFLNNINIFLTKYVFMCKLTQTNIFREHYGNSFIK